MEDELYNKERSTISCIRAAFDYYNKNATKILRKTWISAIIVALLANIPTGLLSSPELTMASPQKLIALVGVASVSFILSILIYILFRAKIYGILNELPTKKNFVRNMYIAILSIVLFGICILCCIGFSYACTTLVHGQLEGHPSAPIIIKCLTGIVLTILIAAIIPFSFANTQYLVEPTSTFSDIFRNAYKIGWKNWGYLFSILFVCTILTSIAYCITFSPAIVLFLASDVNLYGITLGDSNGLPTYFPALAFLLTTLSTLIFIYIDAWLILVFYYTCGNIVTIQKRKLLMVTRK